MSTPITIYPNPPILAGYPTASDPPLAAPQPADLDDPYVSAQVREGGFLTAPRNSYSSTPITGTAASTIGLVITLNYNTSLYEVVYQLGAFTPLYVAGSTVNLGTGAYSLVRAGGFPPGVTVNAIGCTPCPSIPTAGQTYKSLYAVDLTAQGSQDLTAAGSYTINGKVWWAKGTLWAGGTCALVSGSGLRLFCPATVGASQPDRPNFRTVLTGITQRIVTFNPNQLADYNPSAPVFFLWRMSGTISGNSDRCYSAGVMSAASSSAPITDAERATCAQACHHTVNTANPFLCGTGGSQAPTTPIINDANLAHYQTGVLRFARDRFYLISALYSGTEIDPESSAQNVSGVNAMMQPSAQTAANLALYYTLHKAFSDGSTLDIYLTNLTVMQPKV